MKNGKRQLPKISTKSLAKISIGMAAAFGWNRAGQMSPKGS